MSCRLHKYCALLALLVISALAVSLLSGCSAHKENIYFGSDYSLEISGGGALARSKQIETALDALESTLSPGVAQSEVSRVNAAEVGIPISIGKDFAYLYAINTVLYEAFPSYNPYIYPLVELWKFNPGGFTLNPSSVPSATEIEDLLDICNPDSFEFDPTAMTITKLVAGAKLDFGAIAKGYAADLASTIAGKAKYVVNAGGTIKTNKKISVAIASPRSDNYAASFTLDNQAVATSGDYERFYIYEGIRYHHILGTDGYPSGLNQESPIISATVVGPDAAMCDALSTLVFIEGAESAEFLDTLGYSALILTESTYKIIGEIRFEILEPRTEA